MARLILTDSRREKLFHLMTSAGHVDDKPEHKQTFECILDRLCTGIPWRDLPKEFGKSRGGNSTTMNLAVDSGGLPIYFELSEGQKHDITPAPSLIEHLKPFDTVIADRRL